MEIAFSKAEGGEWEYFNSPLTQKEIKKATRNAMSGLFAAPVIYEDQDGRYFHPDGDTLPKAHCFMLPNGEIWDVINGEWKTTKLREVSRVNELFAVLRKQASWIPMIHF